VTKRYGDDLTFSQIYCLGGKELRYIINAGFFPGNGEQKTEKKKKKKIGSERSINEDSCPYPVNFSRILSSTRDVLASPRV